MLPWNADRFRADGKSEIPSKAEEGANGFGDADAARREILALKVTLSRRNLTFDKILSGHYVCVELKVFSCFTVTTLNSYIFSSFRKSRLLKCDLRELINLRSHSNPDARGTVYAGCT